jgi:periplasmic protein TonB
MHIKPTIMTSNEILKADVLDILFDHRNKQYGAYVLRKHYNSRLGLALGISLSSVLLFFFLARLDRSSGPVIYDDKKEVVVIDRVVPPGIKKPDPIIPKQTTPPPAVKERNFVNLIIKEDDLVKNPMTTQNDLINSLISNRNIEGPAANSIPIIKEAVVEKTPAKEEVNPTERLPSREPEFPGGQTAWINFLQKNLIAPSELEAGEKKTVSIRFFVSVDGEITDFEVVQSAGRVFDNEVIRVLRKMPKWKPAIQNGQAIARAFTQPVTFVGIEE